MKTHLGWYGPAAPDVQGIPYIPFSTQLESGYREIAAASVSECSLCRISSTFFREWVSSIVGSICEGGKICLAHPTILPIFSSSGQSRCLENASALQVDGHQQFDTRTYKHTSCNELCNLMKRSEVKRYMRHVS